MIKTSINLEQGPATNMIFLDFLWAASVSLFTVAILLAPHTSILCIPQEGHW